MSSHEDDVQRLLVDEHAAHREIAVHRKLNAIHSTVRAVEALLVLLLAAVAVLLFRR